MTGGTDSIVPSSITGHPSAGAFPVLASTSMSANVRILFIIIRHWLKNERKDEMSNRNVHVTVQAEMLCCLVHSTCLPDELDNDEQTHECTESDLDSISHLGINEGCVCHHCAK